MGDLFKIIRVLVGSALLAGALTSGAPAAEIGGPAPGCVAAGDAGAAAVALHGPGTEVLEQGSLAGFDSALVLAPKIVFPGVRHRLVRAGSSWCDGSAGFNAAWAASGRGTQPAALASAFASMAAATFFDGATVTAVRSTSAGAVELTTHAKTNGVVADWVVRTDGAGVREATWTVTGFAVRPFDASWEGLTALPGLTRSYVRGVDGGIDEVDPITAATFATPTGVETISASAVMSDGFEVLVRNSNTPVGLALDGDTGVATVDFVRLIRAAAADNYETFLEWGLQKGWSPAGRGSIRIDDAVSLFCLACVAISSEFNVHMTSQMAHVVRALGYHYPNDDLLISDILGHEIFHNFQIAAAGSDDALADMSYGYIEGSARFTETLHGYSEVSHQPGSVVYANDVGGCNGYLSRDGAFGMARSPGEHSYDACYFWMALHADHGIQGLVRAVKSSPTHAAKSNVSEMAGLIEAGAGLPYADVMASFTGHALTGSGYVWGAADGTSPPLDWAAHLERWTPSTLLPGASRVQWVSRGGLMGVKVGADSVASMTSTATGVQLYSLSIAGTPTQIASGTAVTAGTWLVAVAPSTSSPNITIRLS